MLCQSSFLHWITYKNLFNFDFYFQELYIYIANNLGFTLILIFIGGGGDNSMPLTCLRTYKWGQMYTILIFSKYRSHKKEIKVNNLTPDYVQNLI